MTAALSIERSRSSMRGSLEDAVSFARRTSQPVFFTQVRHLPFAPDPLAYLAASSSALGTGTLWAQPRTGLTFSGAGSACEMRANGPGRFGAVSLSIREFQDRLIRDEDDGLFPIIGGFAFSEGTEETSAWRDFSDAMLVVPQVVLQAVGDSALVRVTIEIDPGISPVDVAQKVRRLVERSQSWAKDPLPTVAYPSDIRMKSIPDRGAWESSVATAIALIRQDMLDKVVLAREERLLGATPFSPIAALARLRSVDSAATLIAMQSGKAWFIGATPERLARLQEGRVDVTCLAGSIGIGRDEGEQRQLAEQLLASEKDQHEHEIVVRSTMRALEEVCEDVTRLTGTPRVVTARSVQHLETPIAGQFSTAGHVLDLVERLHPTPAVGGHPRASALAVIRELEEVDRGWYAGPFGWTGLDGSGEFAVAIRSALLSGRSASVFAGCGIVAESDPADEYEETCLKLRPMLSALGAL